MSIVVFLGPSMNVQDARALLDAEFLPPVGQGDVYRAVRDLSPDAIGIIDGFFHQQPSVWHREILYALHKGVAVFGGASMGALRAAELAPFGMTGIGRVFEAYRDGVFAPYRDPFDSDDEVAVIHGPAELDWPALSVALVDLRADYAEACGRGLITTSTRDALVRLAAGLHFTGRTHAAVLAAARLEGVPPAECDAVESWCETHGSSTKRRDAEAVLQALDAWRRSGSLAHEPDFHFEEPSAWQAFVAGEEERLRHGLSEAEEAVLDVARFEEPDWDDLRRIALVRASASRAGSSPSSVSPPLDAVQRAFGSWRIERGVTSHAALQEWLAHNRMNEAQVTRLFEDEARFLAAAGDVAAVRRAIVDQLRLSGRFAGLARRADERAAQLAQIPNARREPTPLEAGLLLDRAGPGGPSLLPGRSAEAERIRLAFDTQRELFAAAWRQVCITSHSQ
jgi:hypothetical protein